MLGAIVQRRRRAISLVVATTLVTGVLAAALPPTAALALVLFGAAGVLAWSAPVANLTLVLLLTMILPRSVQRELAIGLGTGVHGLYPSDLLLFAGLARAVPQLLRMRLERRTWLAAAGIALFLAVALLQMLHGFSAGWGVREAGGEARGLLYFGTFLVALPILADERMRTRLLVALLGVGLALGLWGLVQWGLGPALQLGPEVGLRPGVRLTSAGRGQVMGGLYAFPVITVIALAVLALGRVRSTRGQALVFAVAVLNAVSLLFTHERSFWLATMAGVGLVALRAGRSQAHRVVAVTASVFAVAYSTVRALSPGELTTARERFGSVSQYRSDSSVRYRLIESRHLVDRIRGHPFIGSGLGATIYWGPPWGEVRDHHYAHNAYLVLAWKMGVPAALVLIALLGSAVGAPPSPTETPLPAALQTGCQGGLLALLIAGIMFPSFTTFQIVSATGVMLAVCATPASKRRPSAHLTCSRSKSSRSILARPRFARIRPRWSHSLIR
jgi:O-Antigen ligase